MPQIPSSARGARFIGWGTSLGHRVVTNDELTASMDTNDEWIRERTGIHRRHVGGSTAELSTISGKARRRYLYCNIRHRASLLNYAILNIAAELVKFGN